MTAANKAARKSSPQTCRESSNPQKQPANVPRCCSMIAKSTECIKGWRVAHGEVLAEPQTSPWATRQPLAQTDTRKSGANIDADREFHGFCLEIPQRYYRTAFFHLERTINGRGRVIKSVIDVLANSFHVLLELLVRHYRTFKN